MASPDSYEIDQNKNEKFEIDGKYSKISEDFHKDSEKLVAFPLTSEDDEAAADGFVTNARENNLTPPAEDFLRTRKRLFSGLNSKSPMDKTINNLKRLKISEDQNENILESDEDIELEGDSRRPEISQVVALVSPIQKEVFKNAVEKSAKEEDLIGDFSKKYVLPLILGTHPDLKWISVNTMRDVLQGKYKHVLNSYTIIDTRYPYEFEGGHINNAMNLYTRKHYQTLLEKPPTSSSERHILIYYCEFSTARGPNMVRNLRKEDRIKNAINYPSLNFPEIYIVEGGYKKFFQSFPQHCDPMEYTPMLHPEYAEKMRYFKTKCRFFDGSQSSRKPARSSMTRRFLSNDF